MNLRKNEGKVSKTVIIVIAVIATILLIVFGIFAYLLLATDTFKSNEELFWKYMGKNIEIVNIINTKEDGRYINKSYMYYNEIKFELKEDELLNLNDSKSEIGIKNDYENKKMQALAKMEYDGQNLLNVEILKNANCYAIKSNELANGYIAIKNENLNSVAENFIKNYEEFPNKISIDNYKQILNIADEEQKHVVQNYYQVIKNNIDKVKYTKTKDVDIVINNNQYIANEYKVALTQKEFQNVLINTLETLKKDSITLNLIATKLKNINPDSKYTSVNELNNQINSLIEEIKKQEATDEEYLILAVYEKNGETVGTNIEIKDEAVYSISYNKEERSFCITKQGKKSEQTEDWKQINVVNKKTNEQEQFLFELKYDLESDESKTSINVDKEKSDTGYKAITKINVFGNCIIINGEKVIASVDELPNIEDSTNIIINELTPSKQKILVQKIYNRINDIIESKKKIINPKAPEDVQEPIDII